MEHAWEALVPIAFFLAVVSIIKLLSDNHTRRKLIEKGLVDENIKYLFPDKLKDQVSSSLKWGMVLIAIGLAVFVGQMAPSDLVEKITIGCMLIFGGLALVIYYSIAKRMLRKSGEKNAETQLH